MLKQEALCKNRKNQAAVNQPTCSLDSSKPLEKASLETQNCSKTKVLLCAKRMNKKRKWDL
jgi:hypothetical protein